ncbi:hypothetical protein FKM82_025442 [Ascaphus truei]
MHPRHHCRVWGRGEAGLHLEALLRDVRTGLAYSTAEQAEEIYFPCTCWRRMGAIAYTEGSQEERRLSHSTPWAPIGGGVGRVNS